MLYKSPTLLHVGHHVPCNTWSRCRYARQNSPNAAPLPYSTRDKIRPASPKTPLLECFQRAGRTFRAHAHAKPSRAKDFAHRTKRRGDFETDNTSATADTGQRETTITNARPQTATVETTITSATENHSKNAHFSPAKATPVSIPRRRKRAKATPVSDHRAASPAAPKRGPSGRRGLAAAPVGSNDTTATQISHVIYRGHFSRHPKNVAIPTMQIQCLNEAERNYVRNQ